MKETLTTLVKLQRVDSILQKLEAQKGDLPQKVEALKARLRDEETEYSELAENLQNTKKLRMQWDSELKTLDEKSGKFQEQLYEVTSNREYDAITTEIDAVKEKISEAETRILELIEQEETLTKQVDDYKEKLSSSKEQLEINEKELQEKIKSTEKEVDKSSQDREALLKHVDRQSLYQYERIRSRLGNTAVAEVTNYACGSCSSTIPPQKVVEIRMMNELLFCESCGRILVHNSEESAFTTHS